MAQTVGLSQTSVRRIWNAHRLKPHLVRGFKLSNDKRFVEKVQDVVGLYLGPPDKAMVLSVDEKSQVQALTLDRRSFIDALSGGQGDVCDGVVPWSRNRQLRLAVSAIALAAKTASGD
jgi:hypothetical protein